MSKQKSDSEKLNVTIIEAIQDKKGHEIASLNMKKIHNAVADYFVICHGTSRTQVEAIADAILEKSREKLAEKPWHIEGVENAEWILLDYVNVVVHVFLDQARRFYQLEELWADAEINYYDDDGNIK